MELAWKLSDLDCTSLTCVHFASIQLAKGYPLQKDWRIFVGGMYTLYDLCNLAGAGTDCMYQEWNSNVFARARYKNSRLCTCQAMWSLLLRARALSPPSILQYSCRLWKNSCEAYGKREIVLTPLLTSQDNIDRALLAASCQEMNIKVRAHLQIWLVLGRRDLTISLGTKMAGESLMETPEKNLSTTEMHG